MAARPFLLLQSRDPEDPMRGHEVACFERALGIERGAIEVVDAIERVPEAARLRAAAGVLMGGSGDYSSLDPHPWIERMVAWIRDVLLEAGVPTFASCFGFQVTVRALGGTMVRDPEHREVGSIEVEGTPQARDDALFRGLPARYVVQVGHNDRAEGLPPRATLLARSGPCPIHAYRVAGRPFWATQFHPELRAEDVRVRWMGYSSKYPPLDVAPGEPPDASPILRGLRASPEASGLLRAFAVLCDAGGAVRSWPTPGPERRVGRSSVASTNPMTIEISQDSQAAAVSARAYALYVRRGMKPGHELDDWLEAERQVRAEGLKGAVATELPKTPALPKPPAHAELPAPKALVAKAADGTTTKKKSKSRKKG